MGYDITWIVPRLRNPGALWTCASSLTVAVVGLFSKIIVGFLNKTSVHNRAALSACLRRPAHVPLLTVSNHHSCFDDPGLWGVLDYSTLLSARSMRWSLAAHDICFTSPLHAYFFALGKCVPVVRGAGVDQPAITFCVERLAAGEWVHVFPEGRVNVDKEPLRHKWGIGRIVADVWSSAGVAPLLLPIWHEGMDRVLPNREPYMVRCGARVHVHVGRPVPLQGLLERLAARGASRTETRKAVTDTVQTELARLRDSTHRLLATTLPKDHVDAYLANRSDIHTNPGIDLKLLRSLHEHPEEETEDGPAAGDH